MKKHSVLLLGFLVLLLLPETVSASVLGVRIGAGPSISRYFGMPKPGIYVMHSNVEMPDGRIDVGSLLVTPGNNEKESILQIMNLQGNEGKTEFINLVALSKIPCGNPELEYAVSSDNILILVNQVGDIVKVAQDINGNYDIEDRGTNIEEIDNGKYVLTDSIKMSDGRIKIGKKTDNEDIIKSIPTKIINNVVESELLPVFESPLNGSNEVRVRNPNDFNVLVGLRYGNRGRDFEVPANGVSSIFIPNGKYEIYFIYSNKPDALFKGDDFSLNNNGIEIQIVKVVGGNYGIRQVK